jgi:cytochrome oxidase Cu insertion factor (SCO1/SenC/PrrC family)
MPHRPPLILTAWGLSFLLANSLWSQEPEPPGIQIGQQAPSFELKDQQGRDVSLNSLLENKKLTAVVFYRSASW